MGKRRNRKSEDEKKVRQKYGAHPSSPHLISAPNPHHIFSPCDASHRPARWWRWEDSCVRYSYTARRKHGLLATAKRLQNEGRTLWDVTAELKVVIALRAPYLSPSFHEKSFPARCSAVKRFIIAHLMTYWWAHTHLSAHRPKLRANFSNTCDSCAASSSAAIATGMLSSTWTKCWSIFWWMPSACLSS